MTTRARILGAAVICAAATSLAACEGGPLPERDLAFQPLEGEWIACLNDGATDYSTGLLFFPDASFRTTTRTYATTDGTCGGAQTSVSHAPSTYELTGDVATRIGAGGRDVVAKQMNIENSFERVFTIVYADRETTPPVLYFGDLALDPLDDGTAPEKRPEVLSVSTALTGR
jgi:hypothetical protein